VNNTIIGIDLAKTIFQVCIMSKNIKILGNRAIKRRELESYICRKAKTLIVMEPCAGANYWARQYRTTRLTIYSWSA